MKTKIAEVIWKSPIFQSVPEYVSNWIENYTYSFVSKFNVLEKDTELGVMWLYDDKPLLECEVGRDTNNTPDTAPGYPNFYVYIGGIRNDKSDEQFESLSKEDKYRKTVLTNDYSLFFASHIGAIKLAKKRGDIELHLTLLLRYAYALIQKIKMEKENG